MAAPRSSDQTVGGLYRISGDDDDSGGEAVRSSPEGYCSLSDRMVTPDSASGFGGSSEAIVAVYSRSGERVDECVVWRSWPPRVERFPVVGAGCFAELCRAKFAASLARESAERRW